MPVFVAVWILFGLTEAMFALALRKVGFDQSAPERQGRVQGQMASALGIGFTLGPLLGGFVGKWRAQWTFSLFRAAIHQFYFSFCCGRLPIPKNRPSQFGTLWREGVILLKRPFLASCLAICQSFLFLTGVTRIAFPFLATNYSGISLETVGIMVSFSRLTDTLGRFSGGWLCDRINSSRVILLGVAVGIPMFFLQVYGSGFVTLLIPLAVMTMGFGFTNVGATTFALQSASSTSKELSLGISRASTSVGHCTRWVRCTYEKTYGPDFRRWRSSRWGYFSSLAWSKTANQLQYSVQRPKFKASPEHSEGSFFRLDRSIEVRMREARTLNPNLNCISF
jgi:MFS family permease